VANGGEEGETRELIGRERAWISTRREEVKDRGQDSKRLNSFPTISTSRKRRGRGSDKGHQRKIERRKDSKGEPGPLSP